MRKLNLAIILLSIFALTLASCASQPAVEETQAVTEPPATEVMETEEPPMETEEAIATEEMPMETEEPMQTEEAAMAETEAVPAASLQVYIINPEESQASFSIFEELRGQPVTVVGVTNDVAGEISVDLSDLSSAQVSPIVIQAGTLVTDADRRNQAIRNFVLQTGNFPEIIFTPTSVSGLSGSGAPGETYTFQINGDLTIRDITQPETFDVEVQVVSENQLSGVATSVIPLVDYNLQIPDVPFVANVGDEVPLEFRFVAISN
jgi:polyisoprenoid-binding protein YceI